MSQWAHLQAAAFALVMGAATLAAAAETNPANAHTARVLKAAGEAAKDVPSLFSSPQEKIETVKTFVQVVGVRSQSRSEGALQDMLRGRFALLKAREIVTGRSDANRTGPLLTNAPLNLVVEIPATKGFEDKPGIILNAHADTIEVGTRCVPEEMDFAPGSREFFHPRGLSFGADDKAGVTTVLRAVETAKAHYWDKGLGHRRFLVVLTAQEENGCAGSKYLARHSPELFDRIELELTVDGPLDYGHPALYPQNSFIVVVDEKASQAAPYRQVIECVQAVCNLKHTSFAMTSTGLGQGDFAFFPAGAHTDLHLRGPYQGNHSRERVKLDDLFNHIDLLTYIILRLEATPVRIPAR